MATDVIVGPRGMGMMVVSFFLEDPSESITSVLSSGFRDTRVDLRDLRRD